MVHMAATERLGWAKHTDWLFLKIHLSTEACHMSIRAGYWALIECRSGTDLIKSTTRKAQKLYQGTLVSLRPALVPYLEGEI